VEDRGGVPRQGLDKDAVPIVEFRKECRQFAEKWIDVQREEFRRLGVEGDWKHPIHDDELRRRGADRPRADEVRDEGELYRGSKPVMWSVVEKTALAEAEVEYHDYTSDTVWVKFPVSVRYQ
jgi:isoleucyl-tRNA synthetase